MHGRQPGRPAWKAWLAAEAVLGGGAWRRCFRSERPVVMLAQASGSAGLEAWLAAEAERAVPDYKKAWPKYYYYYEWMRERIAAACGELPAPVLDKMLTQARNTIQSWVKV